LHKIKYVIFKQYNVSLKFPQVVFEMSSLVRLYKDDLINEPKIILIGEVEPFPNFFLICEASRLVLIMKRQGLRILE